MQMALEEKQGASNLELLCEELEEKEKRQEEKKELKRQKRRQKKAKTNSGNATAANANEITLDEIPCNVSSEFNYRYITITACLSEVKVTT